MPTHIRRRSGAAGCSMSIDGRSIGAAVSTSPAGKTPPPAVMPMNEATAGVVNEMTLVPPGAIYELSGKVKRFVPAVSCQPEHSK